jgi:endoglucanase
MSMLHTSGRNIVDVNGKPVVLRGFNLGGWFIMETWMAPTDSGGIPDTYGAIQKLDQRFGVATEQSLIRTYQQSWITTTDLDHIKAGGFNVIRVPIWWGQFFLLNNPTPSGWRPDAFTMLDWVIAQAAARGIYTVVDMHGVIGGESSNQDTGQQNNNSYWTNATEQANTLWMWTQIANHYKGNPNVAMYDAINEPMNAPNDAAVLTAYNNIYKTIRAADPAHIITLEATFDSWNLDSMPAPSLYNWTNVVYQLHQYQWSATAGAVKGGSDFVVSNVNAHAAWNVPVYVGEWQDFGTGASTWDYSINDYDNAGLSWSSWSYKTDGQLPDSWGYYDPTRGLPVPNLSTDSAATIAADWQQWTTSNCCALNTSIGMKP